jgi:hypothetical protein
MTTTDIRRPLWQRTWVRVTGSVAALALVAGASAAGTALASPHTVTNRPAANSAPAHPQPAKQAPAKPVKPVKPAKPAKPVPQPTKTIIVQQPPKVIIQQPAAPAAPAPASSLHNVGNSIWASASTSDAFAWNVVSAWDGVPGVKYVYSPVTGQTYAMTYQIAGGYVIATGGNGAYVQF